MSLIEKAAAASGNGHGRSLHTKQPEQTARMIQQSGELTRLIDRVVQANMPDTEKTAKMKESGHRTAIVSCNWPLGNIQSKVNSGVWATMVGRALEGLIGSIEHRQPNGTWVISSYEQDIHLIGEQDFIELAVELVDTVNAPDMTYRAGVPEMNVNVNSSLPPEILALLKRTNDVPVTSAEAAKTNELLAQVLQQLLIAQQKTNSLLEAQASGRDTQASREAPASPPAEPTKTK
jgi:hypothetical protein